MPSKTDFNVSPYYDDFTDSKKFHRVMYRPALKSVLLGIIFLYLKFNN